MQTEPKTLEHAQRSLTRLLPRLETEFHDHLHEETTGNFTVVP